MSWSKTKWKVGSNKLRAALQLGRASVAHATRGGPRCASRRCACFRRLVSLVPTTTNAMATTTMPSHLTKLTVPQLKVLCKERKLTGYSKLAKPALLQKLADSDATTTCNGTTAQRETAADSQDLLEAVRASVTLSVTTATQVNVEKYGKDANTLSKRKHPQAQNSGSAVIPSPALPLRKSFEDIAIHPDGGQRHSSSKKNLCPILVSDDFTAVVRIEKLPHIISANSVHHSQSLPNAPTGISVAQPLFRVSSTKSSSTNHPGTICASSASKLQSSMPPPDHVPVASKSRKRPAGSSFTTPPAKKTKTMLKPLLDKASAESSASSRNKLVLSPCNVPCRVSQCQPVCSPSPSLQENRVSPSRVIPNTVTTVVTPAPGKRFKPLVINKKVSSAATPRLSVPQPRKSATVSSGPAVLSYLDFSPTTEPLPALTPIGLPPSISHRKRVHTWAIILSGLNDDGRRRCVLVSKMFRFAGVFTLILEPLSCETQHRESRYAHSLSFCWILPTNRLRWKTTGRRSSHIPASNDQSLALPPSSSFRGACQTAFVHSVFLVSSPGGKAVAYLTKALGKP